MSGLKFDDFFPGVISSKTHSIIDYIHAGTNFVAAALFYKREIPARDMRQRPSGPGC